MVDVRRRKARRTNGAKPQTRTERIECGAAAQAFVQCATAEIAQRRIYRGIHASANIAAIGASSMRYHSRPAICARSSQRQCRNGAILGMVCIRHGCKWQTIVHRWYLFPLCNLILITPKDQGMTQTIPNIYPNSRRSHCDR
jgi:hypothetical protein